MRQFFLVTHRWLGLAAGLILALAGASGAPTSTRTCRSASPESGW